MDNLFTSQQPGRQYRISIHQYKWSRRGESTIVKHTYWYIDIHLAKEFVKAMVERNIAHFGGVYDMHQGKRGKMIFSAGERAITRKNKDAG